MTDEPEQKPTIRPRSDPKRGVTKSNSLRETKSAIPTHDEDDVELTLEDVFPCKKSANMASKSATCSSGRLHFSALKLAEDAHKFRCTRLTAPSANNETALKEERRQRLLSMRQQRQDHFHASSNSLEGGDTNEKTSYKNNSFRDLFRRTSGHGSSKGLNLDESSSSSGDDDSQISFHVDIEQEQKQPIKVQTLQAVIKKDPKVTPSHRVALNAAKGSSFRNLFQRTASGKFLGLGGSNSMLPLGDSSEFSFHCDEEADKDNHQHKQENPTNTETDKKKTSVRRRSSHKTREVDRRHHPDRAPFRRTGSAEVTHCHRRRRADRRSPVTRSISDCPTRQRPRRELGMEPRHSQRQRLHQRKKEIEADDHPEATATKEDQDKHPKLPKGSGDGGIPRMRGSNHGSAPSQAPPAPRRHLSRHASGSRCPRPPPTSRATEKRVVHDHSPPQKTSSDDSPKEPDKRPQAARRTASGDVVKRPPRTTHVNPPSAPRCRSVSRTRSESLHGMAPRKSRFETEPTRTRTLFSDEIHEPKEDSDPLEAPCKRSLLERHRLPSKRSGLGRAPSQRFTATQAA